MRERAAELTDEQVQEVLGAADVMMRAALGLIALEGLSVGQALSLRRGDVNVGPPPRIVVRTGYHARTEKTVRDWAIDARLAEYLRAYLQSTPHLTPEAPLFPGRKNGPMTSRWAQHAITRLGRSLGLGRLTLLHLRRAAIRRLMAEGVLLPEIGWRLGLTNLQFVQWVYEPGRQPKRSNSITPKLTPGRPRETERDAELVRMIQQPDASYSKVAIQYNQRHRPKRSLTPEAVRKAVKRYKGGNRNAKAS